VRTSRSRRAISKRKEHYMSRMLSLSRRLLLVSALLAVIVGVTKVGEARAALSSYYSASWYAGQCTGATITGMQPHSITRTGAAVTENIAWRTHLWRMTSSGWVLDVSSAWKVTTAGPYGVSPVLWGGDTFTIFKPGKYAVTGEVYYYNLKDSAFTTVPMFVSGALGQTVWVNSCSFGL
jgi:hypothetical protein